MNDRELLEDAANAIGFNIKYNAEYKAMVKWQIGNDYPTVIWNPLADDGDALRLAVKLGLCIITHATQVEYSKGNGEVGVIVEQAFRDLCSTRRAIVRAAAEIGKTK